MFNYGFTFFRTLVVIIFSLLPWSSPGCTQSEADKASLCYIYSPSAMSRSVVKKVLSVEQDEGVGARVRRSVGRAEVGHLNQHWLV